MFYRGEFWFLVCAVTFVFWSIPRTWRKPALALFSLAYLLSLDVKGPLQALGLGIAFYLFVPREGLRSTGARYFTTALILLALGYLAYVKYVPVLAMPPGSTNAAAVALPLGISYFTFKLIHYAVDLRRGLIPPHGFVDFIGYVLHFPMFTAGPIERFEHFLLHRELEWRWSFAVQGLSRVIQGLVKRYALVEVVLPVVFGPIPSVGYLVDHLGEVSPGALWWFLVRTYINAYLDFSSYTDMAIGTSQLLGIRLLENFHFPILATNIAEFWRRWHMTLAGWCQTYVYMPLIGLTRNPFLATYGAFVIIGIWHAGTRQWLLWGLYHATGICAYVLWRQFKTRRCWFMQPTLGRMVCGWILTQLFVSTGYCLSSTYPNHTFYDSVRIFARLFGFTLPSGSLM